MTESSGYGEHSRFERHFELFHALFVLTTPAQLSLTHQILPKEEWTTFEEVYAAKMFWESIISSNQRLTRKYQDVPYLSPLIEQIEIEMKER